MLLICASCYESDFHYDDAAMPLYDGVYAVTIFHVTPCHVADAALRALPYASHTIYMLMREALRYAQRALHAILVYACRHDAMFMLYQRAAIDMLPPMMSRCWQPLRCFRHMP